MRIAYIVGGFPVVSETFIINQIAGMVARGCDVDILATSGGSGVQLPDVVERHGLMKRVHRLDAPRNHLLRLYRIVSLLLICGWRAPGAVIRSINVTRYGKAAATLGLLHAVLKLTRLGTKKYDVIHAQFGVYGPLALRLVEMGALEGPVVTSFRGYDATKYLQANPRAYDALFRDGRLFLAVSRALADRIIAAGCDPKRIVVHHSGIECTKFRFLDRKRTTDEPTRIVIIGRLVEKKGISYGIQAVARVIKSGRRVSCTIIGEGPLRAELERIILKLDVGTHVAMVGSKRHNEVLQVMGQSHILIAPSVTAADGDEEGIPNTVKEAMAMGLPVIATIHAGIPELVEDGVSGFLVGERDAVALAECLVHVIDRPETWAEIGRAGRRRIEAEFDINRLNDELLTLYQTVCAAPGWPANDGRACPIAVRQSARAERAGSHNRSEGMHHN